MPCLVGVFIALLRARVAMPHGTSRLYNSVLVYGIHNPGPTALSSVYPVDTSTSLYNLYLYHGCNNWPNQISCFEVNKSELADTRPFHSNPSHANYRFSSENYRNPVVSARDPMLAL